MIHYLTRDKIKHINAYADLSFKICCKEEYTAMVDLSYMIGLNVRPIEEGMTAALGDGTLVVYADGEIILADSVVESIGEMIHGYEFSETYFTAIDLRGINMSGVERMYCMFSCCEAKKVFIDRIDYRKVDLSYMMAFFDGEIITDDIGIKQYLKIQDIRAEIKNKIRLLAKNSCVVFWWDDEKDKALLSYFDSERKKFEKIKSEICLIEEDFRSTLQSCFDAVVSEKKMYHVKYFKGMILMDYVTCLTEKRELMERWLYELAFSKIDLTDLSEFNRGKIIAEYGSVSIDEDDNYINPEMEDVKQSVINKATENRNRLLFGVNNRNV